ncbi:MAG: methyltransferase domain-containing protein [Desulfotomaculaceae bacterium]|nr:methyltransferase domain-containing protein [Desulfotomaculaceae bacterium]
MSSYLDAIAAMDGGSLHPGGFHHTLKILRDFSILREDIVIDVGCGTGRTACHLAKTYGAHVFALDNAEKMLSKARSRAEREKADVHFVLGDVLDMPFRDQAADLIMIESVLVFLPLFKGVKECFRVLKRKGILVDVELVAKDSLPLAAREQVKAICGLPQIPSFKEWQQSFEEAGFSQIAANLKNFPGPLENLKEILYGGVNSLFSSELMSDANLSRPLQEYRCFMQRYRSHFGFGTFIYRKN